jgi:hypothetical protein
VAPKKVEDGILPAWWEIGPDGTTLGIGWKGWGVEYTEEGATDATVSETTRRGTTTIGKELNCRLAFAGSYVFEELLTAEEARLTWRRVNLRSPSDFNRLMRKACKEVQRSQKIGTRIGGQE